LIASQDRSGWFGASDTSKVIAKNRKTKTWLQWWAVKMGEQEPEFGGSIYTEAGNKYEHQILLTINEKMNLDRQIKVEDLLLRVNYDGDFDGIIYEVKTHKADKEFEVSLNYWRQAQVEMWTYKKMEKELGLPPFKKLYIVSYALNPEEYYLELEDIEIDPQRIKFHEVEYDKHFTKEEYLPCLKQLRRYLKRGKMPQ
jgi:hypothetical protein